MIIQGPHSAAMSLSADVVQRLQALARKAGRSLELRSCHGLAELVRQVRHARVACSEFMLLDPGELADQAQAHPEAGLDEALDGLTAPYIEVHGYCDTAMESRDGGHRPPVATIIHGDTATRYQIALSIALAKLGSQAAPPSHLWA